jgi:GrpB-like predicted nucleotidyltransferase (UPF0157 family)
VETEAAPEFLVPREVAQTVVLSDADPAWTATYEVEQVRIRTAVGDALTEVHHVGSTSVPGLAAKPIIDILLLVRDSTAEETYVPALEDVGYVFCVRERHWHEHRLFKRGTPHFAPRASAEPDEPKVNLHVFTSGASEAGRMLAFRDWLRSHPDDRGLYEQTKRSLAAARWEHVQDYADAKSAVVAEILQRALPPSPGTPEFS